MNPRNTPAVMRGAVDLSALRDRASQPSGAGAAAPSSPPPAGASQTPGSSATIIDVTEATFQTEVLERSLRTPVVIDFWADWCAPCRQLSPVLEKLAIEGGGSWVLAKIDVDANPRIAAAFRVQGIPMVFAIVGGQPVDAFTGVVPEAALRQWIDAVRQVATGGAAPEGEDPGLAAAEDALHAGDLDLAEQAFRRLLADRPGLAGAEAGLARVGLLRRVAGKDAAAALAAAKSAPDDVDAQCLAADHEVAAGQAEAAYARLIDLIRRTSPDCRERTRAHLISLFAVAPPDDPGVLSARRALANALF